MRTVCSRIRLPRRERNTPPARISNLLVNLLQELTLPWDPRAFSSPSRWLRCGTAAKPELTLSVHHGNHAVQQPAAAVVGSPAAGQPKFLLPSGERAAAGHAPPSEGLSPCARLGRSSRHSSSAHPGAAAFVSAAMNRCLSGGIAVYFRVAKVSHRGQRAARSVRTGGPRRSVLAEVDCRVRLVLITSQRPPRPGRATPAGGELAEKMTKTNQFRQLHLRGVRQ